MVKKSVTEMADELRAAGWRPRCVPRVGVCWTKGWVRRIGTRSAWRKLMVEQLFDAARRAGRKG